MIETLDAGPTVVPSVPSAKVAAEPERRFRAMVEAQFDFIWRSLRGLGVPASSADDAAQQVFLIASQKIEMIVRGSERAFLFSTALGVAANMRRTRARSREVSDDLALEHRADDAPDPEELSSQKQARARLDAILEAMPMELRAVFVLYELEGLTMSEIAPLLELSAGTVASRLRRAREEFHAIAARIQARRPSAKRGAT